MCAQHHEAGTAVVSHLALPMSLGLRGAPGREERAARPGAVCFICGTASPTSAPSQPPACWTGRTPSQGQGLGSQVQ